MKLTAISLFATCVALLAFPADAAQTLERSQATSAAPAVEVVNIEGLVRVRAWERNEVRLTGELKNDRDKLEFSGSEHSVTIRVRPEKNRSRDSDGARLEISVPRNASLSVQAVSAEVEVAGVEGAQRLESVSGDIRTEVFGEDLMLRTISGDAVVTGNGRPAVVTLESTSGNVTARGLKGEVEAQSVSGDVVLEATEATRLRLKTVSGDVEARVALGVDARLDAESVSGDLKLLFPAGIDAEFDLETFSGDIDNCFGPAAARKSRYAPGTALRFTQGEGKARVRADTMSGDIDVCNR